MQKINISHLRRKRDYYLEDGPDWIRTIWNKPESFNWFLKNNRGALTKDGAIVRLGRDYFIDASKFPEVAEATLSIREKDEESPT
jgi:hypothetical protein